MEKAFKFRIYPNKTQQVLLQKSFGCARFVYNHFLAKRIEKYKQDKSNMSYNQCSKELTILKQELEWLKEFAITSDGIKYANHKYLAKSLKRLKFLQKSLSRKTKGSSNRNKARIKVARMHQKIANQRRDFLQKLSTEIIRFNDLVCLEDLQVKNMVRNHKLAQAISDVSWSEFIKMLRYKAEWYGRKIVRIDKFFPSSQVCHCCGHKNSETKDLSVREWTCPQCGAVHDRDVNAAINILNEGLQMTGV